MNDTIKKAITRLQQRRPYSKPSVTEEEVFERATLLGASGCNGEVGVCGTAENPGTIASSLGH